MSPAAAMTDRCARAGCGHMAVDHYSKGADENATPCWAEITHECDDCTGHCDCGCMAFVEPDGEPDR